MSPPIHSPTHPRCLTQFWQDSPCVTWEHRPRWPTALATNTHVKLCCDCQCMLLDLPSEATGKREEMLVCPIMTLAVGVTFCEPLSVHLVLMPALPRASQPKADLRESKQKRPSVQTAIQYTVHLFSALLGSSLALLGSPWLFVALLGSPWLSVAHVPGGLLLGRCWIGYEPLTGRAASAPHFPTCPCRQVPGSQRQEPHQRCRADPATAGASQRNPATAGPFRCVVMSSGSCTHSATAVRYMGCHPFMMETTAYPWAGEPGKNSKPADGERYAADVCWSRAKRETCSLGGVSHCRAKRCDFNLETAPGMALECRAQRGTQSPNFCLTRT